MDSSLDAGKHSIISNDDILINMDKIFPINDESDHLNFETSISQLNIRHVLVLIF